MKITLTIRHQALCSNLQMRRHDRERTRMGDTHRLTFRIALVFAIRLVVRLLRDDLREPMAMDEHPYELF